MARTAIALIGVMALMSLASCAWAQDDLDLERPFALKVGAVFPQGDTVDDTEMMVGFEYDTGTLYGPGTFTLTADYIPMTSRVSVTETDTVTLIPVLVNYKWRPPREGIPARWYLGLGAGAYYANRDIPEMDIDNRWSFAWQLFAGANLSPTAFVEGRYIAGSHPGDDGLFGIQAGVRF